MLLAASGQLRAIVRGLRGPAAILALLYCAAVPSSASGPRQTTAPPELRLHHFHIEVEDAALAMREAAAILNGRRTILQGHGPGVQANGRYLVFDRVDDAIRPDGAAKGGAASRAQAIYLQAARWAAERGLAVAPSDVDAPALARGLPDGRISAIALSTVDPASAIERLRRQGTEPYALGPEAARYRLPADLIVEIVADTARPDTHWCPMHPGVRAPAPSKCPVCSMDLVPIPPPRLGEYALDVEVIAGARGRGADRLVIAIGDPTSGERVSEFLDVHERPIHLFIISRDLTRFAHVHPEPRDDGAFAIDHRLEPGEYVLMADFLPAGGTPQFVHRALVTPGYSGPLFAAPPPIRPGATEQTVDGVRVRLEAPALTALRPAELRFTVYDAATDAPATDLEPYLGAPAHLLIVSADLTHVIHGHPEEQMAAGPGIAFDPVLPRAGLYKLWIQVQRNGRVITVPFVIEVAPL